MRTRSKKESCWTASACNCTADFHAHTGNAVAPKEQGPMRSSGTRYIHPMIQNFVFILNNGIRTGVGKYLPDVPVLQQINDPEFHPRAYAWKSGGRAFTRLIDGDDTLTACLMPDGSSIAVLQSEEHYGSDNVVVLNAKNELLRRIANPYRSSKFFTAGDEFSFYGVTASGDDAILHIQVHRKLPGKPYDAAPIYEASYDPSTWDLKKIEWKPVT